MDTNRQDAAGGAAAERRILTLDGWRGVSILLVICGHLVEYRYGDRATGQAAALADVISTLGVCIFFVISGLIITKLALREQAASGQFSARRFYVRRLLRIVPPFYVYLLFVLILTAVGSIRQHTAQTLQAAAFSCDLPRSNCGWFGGHSWSLAYEEQFYLMFPLLFLALGREVRVIIGLLFLAFVGLPLLRFALHLGQPWFLVAHATFYLSFICVGAMIALWRDGTERLYNSRHALHVSLAAVLILGCVVALDAASHIHPTTARLLTHLLLAPTLEPLCVAWLVGWSMYDRSGATRLLETAPIQFIGMISYSLYLWQQVFTAAPADYRGASWLLLYPLMIVFAVLSYYLVERPCVRLAKRFAGSTVKPLPILETALGAPLHATVKDSRAP